MIHKNHTVYKNTIILNPFLIDVMVVDRGSAYYLHYLHYVQQLQFLLVCFQVKEWHQTL